jgi:hypothetical protein
VDALVERPSTCLLVRPDVEVAQPPVGSPDAQVQEASVEGLWPEFGDDSAIELFVDRHILGERVNHAWCRLLLEVGVD